MTKLDDPLFDGIDILTEKLGERYKAIDTYNDFAIKYYSKHGKNLHKTNDKERKKCYDTFYRWVNIYHRKGYETNDK